MKKHLISFACLVAVTLASRSHAADPAAWGTITERPDLKPPIELPAVIAPTFADKDFVITDFGAVADQPATAAISKAIDACAAAGGGRVVIPTGTWATGAIHLKSNVNLHLADKATLSFSDNPDDYTPNVLVRWEGLDCYNYSPLIYARDCTNIAVTGNGTLQGNGKKWWEWTKTAKKPAQDLYDMVMADTPVEKRQFGVAGGLRPCFVEFNSCKNILLEDFTITDGPMWTIHPVYCDGLTARHLNVDTHGPNTDGLNPDSTRNIVIDHCTFKTGDDCITLKSGLNEDGWRVNKPTENVLVQYCRFNGGHGGVVIGSEMSGGVQNVFAHDLVYDGTDAGVRIKSMRGRGGFVRNVYEQDIQMRNIKNQAVVITSFYGASTLKPKSDKPPIFENFHFANLSCEGAKQSILLEGLSDSPIKQVTFTNCNFKTKKAMTKKDVEDVTFVDVVDTVP